MDPLAFTNSSGPFGLRQLSNPELLEVRDMELSGAYVGNQRVILYG